MAGSSEEHKRGNKKTSKGNKHKAKSERKGKATKKDNKKERSKKGNSKRKSRTVDEVEALVNALKTGKTALNDLYDRYQTDLDSRESCDRLGRLLCAEAVYIAVDDFLDEHLEDEDGKGDMLCQVLYDLYNRGAPLQAFVLGTIPSVQRHILNLRVNNRRSSGLDALVLGIYNTEVIARKGAPLLLRPSPLAAEVEVMPELTPLSSLVVTADFHTAHAVVLSMFVSHLPAFPPTVRLRFCDSCQRVVSQGYPFAAEGIEGPRISLGVYCMQEMVAALDYSRSSAVQSVQGREEEEDKETGEPAAALRALEALHSRAMYDLVAPVMLATNAVLHLHHATIAVAERKAEEAEERRRKAEEEKEDKRRQQEAVLAESVGREMSEEVTLGSDVEGESSEAAEEEIGKKKTPRRKEKKKAKGKGKTPSADDLNGRVAEKEERGQSAKTQKRETGDKMAKEEEEGKEAKDTGTDEKHKAKGGSKDQREAGAKGKEVKNRKGGDTGKGGGGNARKEERRKTRG